MSALLVLLPWLPPRRRAGPAEGYHMLVRPDNRIVAVREGETLLDAGLREGVPFPYECRNGGCGQCKATLAYGSVDYGAYQPGMLTEEERRAGILLTCCATPLSEVEIEYVPAAAPGNVPARLWDASVESMELLAPDVMRLMLRLDGEERISFYAGQYLNVLLEDGERRSFSFATAPHVNDRVELQIRRIPGGRFTTRVFESMKPGQRLRFEGPLGSFFLREDSDKPIIFVAGSTGFAPVKSMLEYAFQRGLERRDDAVLGRAPARGHVPRRARPAVARASTTTSSSCRCCPSRGRRTTGTAAPAWRTRRPGRLPRPFGLPGIRLRLGRHGRGRLSGVLRPRAEAGRLLRRRVPPGAEDPHPRRRAGEAGRHGMKQAMRIVAQLALYLPLMALIGTFSTWPPFTEVPPGEALLRLSFIHAAALKHECHTRSAAELAKLPPNMRAPLDCPRERAPIRIELALDGKVLLERELAPAGLRRDGAATAYFRLAVPAGRHHIAVRMQDRAEGGFNHQREASLELAPGSALVIDFDPAKGGFVFRG